MILDRNKVFVDLAVIVCFLAIIGFFHTMSNSFSSFSIKSILYLGFLITLIISIMYTKKNIKIAGTILIADALIFMLIKTLLGSHDSLSLVAASTAVFAGSFAYSKYNYVTRLSKMGGAVMIIAWINSVYILKQGITSPTSILYILLIIYAFFGSEIYPLNQKNMSIMLIIVGMLGFILKKLIGVSVGLGLYGAILIILAGVHGITKLYKFDKKDNYIIISTILAGILCIISPLTQLIYTPFRELYLVGSISGSIVLGIIYILLALYSKKNLKLAAISLITLAILIYIPQFVIYEQHTFFTNILLIIIPASITLIQLKERKKIKQATALKKQESNNKVVNN